MKTFYFAAVFESVFLFVSCVGTCVSRFSLFYFLQVIYRPRGVGYTLTGDKMTVQLVENFSSIRIAIKDLHDKLRFALPFSY